MGDADNEVVVPVEEIEQWMDEALEVVDEGLESLVAFIAHLYLYKMQISLRLKNMENFRLFFTALNLLVLPVIITLLISYGTSSYEYDLESLLMFFSGFVGLPFYLLSAWGFYRQESQVNEELSKLRDLFECEDDDSAFLTSGDSFTNFLSADSSVDRLHGFARMLSNRMLDRAREEVSTSDAHRDQEVKSSTGIDTNAFHSLGDLNISADVSTGKQDPPEVKTNGSAGVLYEFKIRMKEQSPNLEVKIEPCDEEIEPCDDKIEPCDDKIESCDDKIEPCDEKIEPCDDEREETNNMAEIPAHKEHDKKQLFVDDLLIL